VNGIDLIAFDGDDTLWHSEQLFADTQVHYHERIAPHLPADLSPAAVDELLLATEHRNLPIFGYGAKGFTLSLIETAIEVSGGRIGGHDVQAIIDLGKALLDHPVELIDGVEETITALAEHHRLLLVTKGDLFHQETKIARSGLADRFWRVEIVSEKDEATFARILAAAGVDADRFLMVGNSVRSDVLPVVALGGHAAHVPYHVTWALEHVEDTDPERDGYTALGSITEVPALVELLESD
jgi:putative hydrolase of the HAD superfamily